MEIQVSGSALRTAAGVTDVVVSGVELQPLSVRRGLAAWCSTARLANSIWHKSTLRHSGLSPIN